MDAQTESRTRAALLNPRAVVFVVVWDDDGAPNAQAYLSREAALRDFPRAGEQGTTDPTEAPIIVESTVQP